jgi:hypothetical protein
MGTSDISFPCDPAIWQQFVAGCRKKGLWPEAVLAELVATKVRAFEREDQRGVATRSDVWMKRLQGLVAQALANSRDWSSLRFAMDRHGIAYHPAGKGLIVIDASTGEVLCKASEVGPGYGDLVRRFGQGFPGHPKPWLAEEALAATRKPSETAA